MALMTVKKLKEVLNTLPAELPVGYVDGYGKFHPLKDNDVYTATGHFDPEDRTKPWQELLTQTKPKVVININIPEVRVWEKKS